MRLVVSTFVLVGVMVAVDSARAAQTPTLIAYDTFCKIADVDERRAAFLATSAENRGVLVRTQVERWRDANRARLNPKQLDTLNQLVAAITPETYSEGPKGEEARAKARALGAVMEQLFTRDDLSALQPMGPCIAKGK